MPAICVNVVAYKKVHTMGLHGQSSKYIITVYIVKKKKIDTAGEPLPPDNQDEEFIVSKMLYLLWSDNYWFLA